MSLMHAASFNALHTIECPVFVQPNPALTGSSLTRFLVYSRNKNKCHSNVFQLFFQGFFGFFSNIVPTAPSEEEEEEPENVEDGTV